MCDDTPAARREGDVAKGSCLEATQKFTALVLAGRRGAADAAADVLAAADASGHHSLLDVAGVPMLLRVSSLDWFEHEHRFDREGDVYLEVEVKGVSRAGVMSTWLWRGLVGEDWLEVRVTVRDSGGLREDFTLTERTAVEGWEWRDADARLDRMARRLGRRIAELL